MESSLSDMPAQLFQNPSEISDYLNDTQKYFIHWKACSGRSTIIATGPLLLLMMENNENINGRSSHPCRTGETVMPIGCPHKRWAFSRSSRDRLRLHSSSPFRFFLSPARPTIVSYSTPSSLSFVFQLSLFVFAAYLFPFHFFTIFPFFSLSRFSI
jgi:hypothetical protein